MMIGAGLIYSCNNRNSASNHNSNHTDLAGTISNRIVSNNIRTKSIYDSCKYENLVDQSDEILGYWSELRPDDDKYLLGHYLFNADGTGFWSLTGSLDNDTDNRGTIYFTWHQDESGDIITENQYGEVETLSFQAGLIIRQDALGNEIYQKE